MTGISKEHEDYFTSELPDAFRKYMKYGNYPQHAVDKKLRTDEYEVIIREFCEWAKRDLNSDYLPTEDVVKRELCLIKAECFDDKGEDVAFFGDILSEIRGRPARIRITQTGGLNSSLYIFVCYPDLAGKISLMGAEVILSNTMRGVLNNSSEIEALIQSFSEHREVISIHKKPIHRWIRHLQTFEGFLFHNTVCLTFRKIAFAEDPWDVPAREPRLNEWFEYHRSRE
jgi:hypothetical protein